MEIEFKETLKTGSLLAVACLNYAVTSRSGCFHGGLEAELSLYKNELSN